MYFYSFTALFITTFLAAATIVLSLPMQRRQTISLPASTTFKVSKEAVDQLTDITDKSVGLIQLWKHVQKLTNEAWLTAEVRNLFYNAHAYISRALNTFVVSTSATQGMQRSHL